jgi:phage terminase small subunit
MDSNHSRGNGKTLRKAVKRGSTSHTLTARQKFFALEYLKDLNATQAAIRVGYSPKTAFVQASRLLSNVKVQGEVQKAMDARAKRIEISADKVLQAIALQAFYDTRRLFDEDGNCKPIHELDDQTADALVSFEVVKKTRKRRGRKQQTITEVVKYRLADKRANRELLGRHLGLFKDINIHGFDESTRKLLADKLDVTKLTEEQLLELATLATGSSRGQSKGRSLPAQYPRLAYPHPHAR